MTKMAKIFTFSNVFITKIENFGHFGHFLKNIKNNIILLNIMEDLNIENLLSALDNETNEKIMKLTPNKIKEQKNNILQRLQLDRDTLKSYHTKLKDYRYCSDLTDIKFGQYIRWIPLKDVNKIYLTRGAILCDYKVVNGKLHIMCKSNFGKIFQIKFDEVEIFQKLNHQEKILLKVIELLDKN